MTEPTALNAPADRLAAAKAAQAAREAGIKANAIKQGRELERAETAIARAEQAATHSGELQGIKQAHTEEIARLDERWAREERKHGAGRFWSGVSTGVMAMLAIGSVFAAVYTTQVMNASFDAARESRVQDDVLRTLQRPPTTDEPRSQSAHEQ